MCSSGNKFYMQGTFFKGGVTHAVFVKQHIFQTNKWHIRMSDNEQTLTDPYMYLLLAGACATSLCACAMYLRMRDAPVYINRYWHDSNIVLWSGFAASVTPTLDKMLIFRTNDAATFNQFGKILSRLDRIYLPTNKWMNIIYKSFYNYINITTNCTCR